MTPIEVLRERVERGAAFLDEHEPTWWKLLRENQLDLGHCDECVLGQIYGGYGRGLEALLGADDLDWSVDHGFTLLPPDNRWRALGALWLEAIAQRKNQGDMT